MLTDKQKRFVEEYLVDLNATQAAIRAGYSEKTARSVGSENLTKPDIMAAIEEAQAARSERTGITADQVLTELAKIGFYDIRKAVRWGRSPVDTESENASPNGLGVYPVELVPSEQMDDDTAAAVSEVSLTQNGIKIKMHDKRAALVDIGRHLGMFKDKVEHSGPNGGPLQIAKVENVIIDPSHTGS
jgi:phage terminase small subunit